MKGCEILKDTAPLLQAPNERLTMWQPPGRPCCFLLPTNFTCLPVGHIHHSLLDFCFASLFPEQRSLKWLSESANRQQSLQSNSSFDLDPLGIDQS